MKERILHGAAVDIQRRVIHVIDELLLTEKMKSLSAWCVNHDLNRVKYSNIRTTYKTGSSSSKYKTIDIDVLTYLVQDFGVSADWLITGAGRPFI